MQQIFLNIALTIIMRIRDLKKILRFPISHTCVSSDIALLCRHFEGTANHSDRHGED